MPRARAMRYGERLGNFAYLVARKQRFYARRNLRLTEFPSSTTTNCERDVLIRSVFVNFSKSLVDFLCAPGITPEALEHLVVSDGFQNVTKALEEGRGVILITAHLGNWEFLGRWLAQHGVPLTVVARDPEDPQFSAYVRKLRENAGFRVAPKGGSVRELLKLLKQNEAIGLLPDQNSGDVFVPFFGVPAGTVAGPASLVLRTGAILVPTYCVRMPDDTYRLLMMPPIDCSPSGDKEADILRIMTDVNTALESVIRQYPGQWLWIHNRWKAAFEEKNYERSWPGIEGQNRYNSALLRWQGEDADRPT